MLLSDSLIQEVAWKLLPIEIKPGGGDLITSVIAARFCHGEKAPDGFLLTVAVEGPPPTKTLGRVVEEGDCKVAFRTLAADLRKRHNFSGPAILARVEVSWNASELILRATKARAINPDGKDSASSRALTAVNKGGIELAKFRTDSLTVTGSDGQDLSFHMGIGFTSSGAWITALPSAEAIPSDAAPSLALTGVGTFAAWLSPEALAYALKHLYQPQTLPIDPPVADQNGALLSEPKASFNGNDFLLAGMLALQPSGRLFGATTTWSGDKLTLASVGVTSVAEECNGSFGAKVACKGRNAAASGLASAAQSTLTSKYKGLLLKPTNPSKGRRLKFNGKEFDIFTDVENCSVAGGQLLVNGTARLERVK